MFCTQRTYSRPLILGLQNSIKAQAREHPGFRRICITFAQQLHRIDMRMRVGLLRDPAVIDRQVRREQEEAEAKRNPTQSPTVKTEEESEAEKREREEIRKKLKKGRPVRPLSDAKAIDSGATFISETFLFLVAGGCILLVDRITKKKARDDRDELRERIDTLQGELDDLRTELGVGSNSKSESDDRKSVEVSRVRSVWDYARSLVGVQSNVQLDSASQIKEQLDQVRQRGERVLAQVTELKESDARFQETYEATNAVIRDIREAEQKYKAAFPS